MEELQNQGDNHESEIEMKETRVESDGEDIGASLGHREEDNGSLGDDDSDDEPIVRSVRRKKRVNRSFLEDSDSEDEGLEINSQNSDSRQSSPSHSRSSSRSTSPSADSGMKNRSRSCSPSRPNSSGNSTASSRSGSPENSQTEHKSKSVSKESERAVSSDEETSSGEKNKTTEGHENANIKKKFFKLSEIHADLFDSESESDNDKENKKETSSSSDDEKMETDNKNDEDGSGEQSGDEEEDESTEMSAALKRRLKMGAAKKETKARPDRAAKPKKADLTEIYGESQRIVRESELKLPYHKPQPPALSGFLAKMQQKQSQLGYLKKTPGKSWKNMHVMHSKIEAPRIDLTKNSPLKEKSLNVPEEVFEEKQCNKSDLDELEDDELPDLSVRVASAMKEKKNKADENCTLDTSVNVCANSKKSDQDKKVPEQDSGYLTTPGISSEEENSSEPNNENTAENPTNLDCEKNSPDIKLDHGVIESQSNMDTEDISLVLEDGEESKCGNGVNIEAKNKEKSPKSSSSAKKLLHSGLSQELGALGVASITPTLSGGPDWMIDLDDDPPAKKPSGVTKLMERLMKHSTKKHGRKGQDVELSTVEKDTDETTGREELKVKTLTIHLDDEEEEDPKLKQPGAKLIRLKETLAAEMARKRAELRKEKTQMHDLENEEGFDMDDEAELTDQTDTDEEEEMEEEEPDDEEDVATEKEEKENNPFVDDEAEDDDEDEENMHLELDNGDDDDSNNDKESSKEKAQASNSFLKAALQKTKTMDLYDDDAFDDSNTIKSGCDFLASVGDMAIDDSLTLSQNKREKIELSDRPFKSLSQERRPGASVDDLLKHIGTNNDSLEEDSTLEKDSSLDEGSIPAITTDDMSHSKLSLFEKDGSSMASNDASFDSVASSLIPAGQRISRRDTPDLFTPSSKGSVATCSTAKSSRRLSELTMPIEDTQDLLKCSPTSESTPRVGTGNLSFNLDDSSSYSQMLDADGLFKTNSSGKKAARRQLELGTLLRMSQENEDELLELCSGKFTAGNQEKPKGAFSGLSQLVDSSQNQNDGDELLGLCSGQFTGNTDSNKSDSKKIGILQTQTSREENVDELVNLCSGEFTENKSPPKKQKGKKRRVVTDDSDEGEDFEIASNAGVQSDNDTDELASDAEKTAIESDDEEEEQRKAFRSAFRGFKSKKGGKIRKHFVEEEAELSGSEYGSDEDLDLDEHEDVMEDELGDLEDLPSDDELRNQVGRVHLKKMIDEDKRELRLYQEMYLADGDLHSEGSGRQRRFRWKNIDDEDTQQDMFNSDDEKDDAEEEADLKWRMERYEREKFISEQQAEGDEEAGSQVLKLGKALFKPKKGAERQSVAQCTDSEPDPQPTKDNAIPQKNVPEPSNGLFKVPSIKNKKPTHGSFLTRSRDTLAKIAEMTRPVCNPTGPRNSRNFVFSTVEKEGEESSDEPKKPQPVKRSNSVPASSSKPAKRQKMERSTSVLPQNSIFHHFD